jgi:hypothetical protein
MYQILPYTIEQAKKLNVIVKPSENQKFKIDVYDLNNKFLFSGGSPPNQDYPHYIQSHGKVYADARRLLYHERHKKEIKKVGSRGWVIAQLLW